MHIDFFNFVQQLRDKKAFVVFFYGLSAFMDDPVSKKSAGKNVQSSLL
jgi:hypothetical protein